MVELEKEIVKVGKLEILAFFRTEKDRKIVGGKVLSGKMKKGLKIKVIREDKIIGEGKLSNLQMNKKDAEEVGSGKECGVVFTGHVKMKEGDILEAYEEKVINKKV